MTAALNPRYRPPSREDLSNTLIPAWYSVEKQNVIQELAQVQSWPNAGSRGLMESVGLVIRSCGFESRLRQDLSTTEVRP